MLSVVIIAKNEADRIGACLDSVAFAAERLVVVSDSTDATAGVARAHGATVVETDWPGFVAQKNRAMGLATQPWVLSLDADERLSVEAAEAVLRAVGGTGGPDGYRLRRRNLWLGRPLRHGRWYPDRKLRLVRAGHGRWVGEDPPDWLEVSGPIGDLDADIVHVPYRSIGEHLVASHGYATRHAAALHARGERASVAAVLGRPALRFVDGYLLRMGFLDGAAGFAVAGLGGLHAALKWGELWRLGRR